jgi:hypothetical protein
MRVSPFISVLFAASMLGGVALADRPAEDGMGRSRHVQPREMSRSHEAREAREARPQREATVKVRDNKVTERFRARGDMNERYGSRASGAAKSGGGAVNGIKAQRDADKALHRLTDKATAVQNCSPTDDTCLSSRVAKTNDKADKAAGERAVADKQRAELKAQIDRLREQKLKQMVMKSICEKHANMCAENL